MENKLIVFDTKTKACRFVTGIALFVTMIMCSSCASPPIVELRTAHITTFPSGATVAIDEQVVATSPTSYDLNFSNQPVYTITCSKDNYLPVTVRMNLLKLDAEEGKVHVTLLEHPYFATTSAAYPANSWITLKLVADVQEREAWNRLSAKIKRNYPSIKKNNGNTGHVETQFIKHTYIIDSDNVYLRHRLKTRFSQEYPSLLMGYFLQTEVSDDGLVWRKYNRVVKSDVSLLNSIKKSFSSYR